VEQNPPKQPNGRKPDYKIEGETFDCYSPAEGKQPRGICSEVNEKVTVKNQTERVVLNLDDWNGNINDLRAQFRDHPIPGLKEVLIVKDGQVFNLF
jgi:hypothetical protein